MNEECLICKAPLEYLETDEEMECELCHKKQRSKTRCVNGHFVCDDCHIKTHASRQGSMGTFQSNDSQSIGSHRQKRRSSLLQTRFLSRHHGSGQIH